MEILTYVLLSITIGIFILLRVPYSNHVQCIVIKLTYHVHNIQPFTTDTLIGSSTIIFKCSKICSKHVYWRLVEQIPAIDWYIHYKIIFGVYFLGFEYNIIKIQFKYQLLLIIIFYIIEMSTLITISKYGLSISIYD